MKTVGDILKEMRGKVPMYIGRESILEFAAFLNGFNYALESNGFSG